MQPLGTVALGATVTWFSNELRFWDGQVSWAYDFPGNRVEALAIDLARLAVAARIPTGAGRLGLMLLDPTAT